MRRLVLALCVPALLLAAALPGVAGSAGSSSSCSAPLACGDDVAAMTDLETKAVDHLHSGFMVGVDFRDAEQRPGEVVGAGGYGDSGLWTGVYLAGESFRYATAQHYLSNAVPAAGAAAPDVPTSDQQHAAVLTPAERTFWTTQRDEALARVRQMVDAFHRNVNIAAAWQTQTKVPPTVDPGNSVHQADFGGGVIHGEPGMLMRACTPTDDPLGIKDNGPDDRVFGPFPWEGRSYWCETAPSRDTYAGTTFGMLTAFDLVSADDPAMRAMLRDDLAAMGDFLLKYGWSYPRPHGYVSTKHDFDGAASPLFVYVPMARLNLTNAVRHVLDVAGDDPAARAKWDAVWAEELSNQGPELGPSLEVDSAQPNDGYYKFNLHHLAAFNLLRTTTGAERDLVLRAFGVMDKTTRDDVNAHFEAITYAMSGDSSRLSAAVTHLRQWLDYRATIETGAPVRNSAFCGTSITCVPEDQYELGTPAGDVTWFPGQPDVPPLSESAGPRAARPLPVAVRPPTDFLWQRPPTQLDGQTSATYREPGIDYLTPYWMLRYYTEVQKPASTPIPEWAGPAHL